MFETIIFFSLNLLVLIGDVATGFNGNLRRDKRYLVNPNAGPSRAQFIFGLGVPVEFKEQHVTVGSVIKMQYLVPVNSSEYTSRIFGFANTVSRDMNGDVPNVDTGDEMNKLYDNDENYYETTTADNDLNEVNDDNKTLVDINFAEGSRRKRALLYSEGGAITNDLNNNNYKMSLDEAIRRQEMIDEKYKDDLEPERANRWDFYKILERTAERYGYSGRPCLLRTICEAAEVPFTYRNGLFGEIGHILFTPSTSDDELSHHTDNEYHAAERLGRDKHVDCETMFPECETSVLDTFTKIGLDTLHKFGLN